MKLRLYGAAVLLGLVSSMAQAVTCTSVAGANSWSVAATWSCTAGGAHVPLTGEDVVIPVGSTVTLNVGSNNLASLTVNGTLGIGNSNTNRTLTVSGNVTVS